jgi:hypothetical protein
MPRNLFLLPAARVLHCSGKRRSDNEPAWRGARRAKKVGITALVLVLFCTSSALADDFGLGTAGPGYWGILETGSGTVSIPKAKVNSSGILVGTGGNAFAANLGIASGGTLNMEKSQLINGTFYAATGSTITSTGTINGGTVSGVAANSVVNPAVSSATSASATLAGLANTQAPPNLNNPGTSVTLTGTAGRNVIYVHIINLGAGISLTLSGPPGASWVINVTGSGASGGISLAGVNSNILVAGGVTPANVMLNVVGGSGANVSITDSTVDGIVMDLAGSVTLSANKGATGTIVNGEIISGQNITLDGTAAEFAAVNVVVPGVPEPSAATYFTLGPVSLIAVMLLHRRLSRRKRTIVPDSHDPPESVLGAVKWC